MWPCNTPWGDWSYVFWWRLLAVYLAFSCSCTLWKTGGVDSVGSCPGLLFIATVSSRSRTCFRTYYKFNFWTKSLYRIKKSAKHSFWAGRLWYRQYSESLKRFFPLTASTSGQLLFLRALMRTVLMDYSVMCNMNEIALISNIIRCMCLNYRRLRLARQRIVVTQTLHLTTRHMEQGKVVSTQISFSPVISTPGIEYS